MSSIQKKLIKNIKSGTLLKNGLKAIRNRTYKYLKASNSLYFLDKERVQTKEYLKKIPTLNKHHYKVGNYFLDQRIKLGKESIIYSLGIYQEISFDLAVSEKFRSTVYMYDPTDSSIEFMKGFKDNPLLKFFPFGVWTENTTLKFYIPKFGGSASAVQSVEGDSFEAQCFTMGTLMQKNGHEYIDVFKADIEGAALPILMQMTSQGIFPNQVVVEFERPKKDGVKLKNFFNDVEEIRNRFKNQNYLEFQLPRGLGRYNSIEMLFVNQQAFTH